MLWSNVLRLRLSFLGDNSCSFATSESLSTPQKSLLCHPMLCDTKTRRLKDMNKFCFSFYCIYLFACLCTSVHTCMPSTQVQLSGQHLEVCPLLLPNRSREIKHQINTPGIFYLFFLHHFMLLTVASVTWPLSPSLRNAWVGQQQHWAVFKVTLCSRVWYWLCPHGWRRLQ